jgi:hypothetical protein
MDNILKLGMALEHGDISLPTFYDIYENYSEYENSDELNKILSYEYESSMNDIDDIGIPVSFEEFCYINNLEDITDEEEVEEKFFDKNKDKKEETNSKEDSKKELEKLKKKFKKSSGLTKYQLYSSATVSDEDFKNIKKYFDNMHKDNIGWFEYSKNFKNLCKYCFIQEKNCVIDRYVIKKGLPNANIVIIQYTNSSKKVRLPKGAKLYHRSPVNNITALKPSFKSKGNLHLYSYPRVYLTIMKNIPSIVADQSPTQSSYIYEVTSDIKEVFIDPMAKLMYGGNTGACYVESILPIKCKKIKSIKKADNIVNNTISKALNGMNEYKDKEGKKDV